MRKRNLKIDIIRGLAMICIVLGHCGFPYTRFIYLFHVAVFFIISGYCFNEKKIQNFVDIKKYIITKIKRLYLPFVICNMICVIFNNCLIKLCIYNRENHVIYNDIDYLVSFIKIICFRGHTELLGATWFLEVLCYISILYAVITFVSKDCKYKKMIRVFVAVILLIIGQLLVYFDINIVIKKQVLFCYIMYEIGYIYKEYDYLDNKEPLLKSIIKIIICICFLCVLLKFDYIEISQNYYGNMFFYMFASLIGWNLLIALSNIIEYCTKYVKNTIAYIGNNTMIILFLHFLAFKVINFIYVVLYSKDINDLSVFPVVCREKMWWLLYSITGIFLPITIKELYFKIKNKFLLNKKEED